MQKRLLRAPAPLRSVERGFGRIHSLAASPYPLNRPFWSLREKGGAAGDRSRSGLASARITPITALWRAHARTFYSPHRQRETVRGGCAPLTPSLSPLAPHQPGRSRQHHRPSLHPHYRFSFVNIPVSCSGIRTHANHTPDCWMPIHTTAAPHVRVRDATTLPYDPLPACLPWNWSLALKVRRGGRMSPVRLPFVWLS